jgi:hypothetical protein
VKIKVKKTIVPDPVRFIRRAGYGLTRSRETSFVKHFDRNPFPRFHLYLDDEGENWSFNLHLDQRAPVYKGVSAHSGEYEGEVVEREVERIKEFLIKK